MEQEQSSSLFGLGIDPTSKAHLAEAAKWAKFLAIVGFVMCGLIVVVAIFASSFLTRMGSFNYDDTSADYSAGMAIGIVIYYLVIVAVVFFIYLFMYRFASLMQSALAANDQALLNKSFQNLKITFRYAGILTIIGLVLMVLGLLIGIAGAAAFS